MRKRRPPAASLEEVTIRREGHDAIIDFRDPTIASTHFRIGPAVRRLSDRQILDRFNALIAAERQDAAAYRHVAVEIPPGAPQIRYVAVAEQWIPRGAVLRCMIDDSGPESEAVVHIDDQSLSLQEFGRLLCTYAGWGMRIAFVPEDDLDRPPRIAVREPAE